MLVFLGELAKVFGAVSDGAICDFAKGFIDRFRIDPRTTQE